MTGALQCMLQLFRLSVPLNLLIPIVQIINIGKPGNQHFGSKIIWGLVTCFSNIDYLYTGNRQLMWIRRINDFNKIE